MSRPEPRTILITGATGAIGGALARNYAEPGVVLVLHGRNPIELEQIRLACTDRGAQVITHQGDLTEVAAARTWLEQLCTEHPLDLVVLNAGMNIHTGPNGEPEDWSDAQRLITLNLMSVMALADVAIRHMQPRGTGQIALVSSLAGYFGLPVTPAYCASKAGLKAYGEALRGWLGPMGIQVNVIMPGYVSSPMCAGMPGPKPFEIDPDSAARRIRQGLRHNRARISFPFPLNLGTWFLAALPAGLSGWIVQRMGYR